MGRMMSSWLRYDFGYSWPFTFGHLLVGLVALAMASWGVWSGWRAWVTATLGAIAAWGGVGAFVMHSAIQISAPSDVAAAAFVPSGGRVLDLGAGSGRATVGLLLARPTARVTAVDLYQGYYGIDDNTPARLMRNAAAAGVADRVEVKVADMRTLPFDDGAFDAAMSVAAIDHLPWEAIERTMRETARVLKPHGQFLVVSLNVDGWVRVAMPTAIHGGGYWGQSQNSARWREAFQRNGFDVVDTGTHPATLYWLVEKR